MRYLILILTTTLTLAIGTTAQAFCGFFVARADTELFNEASQVVLVRDGDRTVITMANDFQGETEDFAIVIPVPTFIEREQINVGDQSLIDHLDAYTAPRLVEYHDPDPCYRYYPHESGMNYPMSARSDMANAIQQASAMGVTIEATYTVGEYDILILSAEESDGLIRWLKANDYRIPDGAERVVGSYLKQDMRFFAAKVNLSEHSRLGYANLRPIQVAYESKRFMLPIRLGTLNAKAQQELFVYALTRTGRVETTNYRNVKLPSDTDVPEHVQDEFGDFYRAMFATQVQKEYNRAVFLEYAWDMAWCDPCAADPLSASQLRKLGVFWLDDNQGNSKNVFVTRLHVRYDSLHFPTDLMFQETGDRQNFQGRYVIRHPWRAETSCNTDEYRATVRQRQEREAETLAALTGWDINEIRRKIEFLEAGVENETPWWKKLWSKN